MKRILPCLILLLTQQVQGQLKNATLVANCRSIGLNPFGGFISGIGNVVNYVTTFDGQNGIPLRQDLGGGLVAFSGELRPRAGQPGVYEADYLTVSSGVLVQYGWMIVNFPTVDSDSNGLPDISQKDKSVNAAISGSVTSDWPLASTASLTGQFSRNANSTSGSFAVTLSGAGGPEAYNGTWVVDNVLGSVSYQREPQNLLFFNLSLTDSKGAQIALTGSTTFTVQSHSQISFPQFFLTSSDNKTFTVLPATLNRAGNKYTGNMELNDGTLETSWKDYVNWVVEIVDTNDSNGNGIPDLSDALGSAPAITTQPVSQTVRSGTTVTFTVAATGSPAPTYQWLRNGVNYPGATANTLTLSNVQAQDAGTYSVRVSNNLGSVMSATVTLRVLVAPSLSNPRLASNVFSLTTTTINGLAYFLESKDSVDSPSWTLIRSVTGTGSPMTLTDTSATVAKRIYRVRVE